MTQEEIEKQAEIYAKGKHCKDCSNISICWENAIDDCCTICERTNDDFIAGAKWGIEHAIEWHDLREDPNDLPNDDRDVINERGMLIWCKDGVWYESDAVMKIRTYPLYWCELPQFKE